MDYKRLEKYCSDIEMSNIELSHHYLQLKFVFENYKRTMKLTEIRPISNYCLDFVENNKSYFGEKLEYKKLQKIDYELNKIIMETYEIPKTIEDFKRLQKTEKYKLGKIK